MSATRRILAQLVIAAMLLATLTVSAADYDFPGQKPDRRILKTQEKVDALFENGDYERALFIYRVELAPLGDKFAQYMIGFMYLSGRGLPVDVALSSAWYRLAAERSDKQFVRSRDDLWKLLNDEQRVQSDLAYVELRKTYSDAALVAEFVEQDLLMLSKRVDDSSVSSFQANTDYVSDRARFERDEDLVKEIRDRMRFLTEFFQSGQAVGKSELTRFEQLEERANRLLEAYEDRN